MYGVVNVVITETATAIGYKCGLITPNESPNDAIINENSPICDKLIPVCIDDLSGCPAIITPTVTKNGLANNNTSVASNTGNQYSLITEISISIPTETKNTAPNMFFSGLVTCSIFSA